MTMKKVWKYKRCEAKKAVKNGTLLDEAKAIINAERQREYGPPHASFRRIAGLWSAYLDITVHPRDVACMMALLKIGREAHAHKRDNLVDAAGYSALAEDVAGGEA
jgi:hypothetical protein